MEMWLERRSARKRAAPSVMRADARMPPPPPAAVEDFARNDDDRAIIIEIADHHHGIGEAERIGVQLAAHARGAALGEVFHAILQHQHAIEAGEDLVERPGAAGRMLSRAAGVDIGHADDLAGALVDQELQALFG